MTHPSPMHEKFIRVDLAGEKGACDVYAGQIWAEALCKKTACPITEQMYVQEVSHYAAFERLSQEWGVSPTKLSPLWKVLGWSLGAVTQAAGTSIAMTCTAAIEEVITVHYAKQLEALDPKDPLFSLIFRCQQEEAHHQDQAYAHGAYSTGFVYGMIKGAMKGAIWLSERI